MSTYNLYTSNKVVTVENCSCYAEALHKTGLFDNQVLKVVEVWY